jgi:hypothetical protein
LKNGGRTADTLRHLIGQAEHHGACIGELPLTLEL